MSSNIPRLTLLTGPNPVYGNWQPHLELPADLEPIDLGLLAGPILDDVDYITDYSGPSPNPPARRYRGLADVVDAASLADLRLRTLHVLTQLLADGESWYLFVRGTVAELPDQAHFSGHIDADGHNGDFTIFEVPADELTDHAALFAAFDRVAGLAAPAGTLRTLLAHLSLAAPLPTGQRYRFASPFETTDSSALVRVLAAGRLFFEEIDNGTRLRFIARTSDTLAARRALAIAIAGP
jgi:hypothetical protein